MREGLDKSDKLFFSFVFIAKLITTAINQVAIQNKDCSILRILMVVSISKSEE